MKIITIILFTLYSVISFAGDADGTGSDPSASQDSSDDSNTKYCIVIHQKDADADGGGTKEDYQETSDGIFYLCTDSNG